MPGANDVQDLLKVFFGDGTRVVDSASTDLANRHVATFISDTDELVAVCVCDPKFVAYSGSAFSMVPVAVADEMARSLDFTEAVTANFHEVMNICSRLLMSDASEHLRLDKTLMPADGASFVAALQERGELSDFQVDIDGYGEGYMAVLVT